MDGHDVQTHVVYQGRHLVSFRAEGALRSSKAIRSLLDEDAEIAALAGKGQSVSSDFTVEALLNILPRFDFAVLVKLPDDVTTSRDNTLASPRDNVIFELRLFMGKLGRRGRS